jgi:hypothetical protein
VQQHHKGKGKIIDESSQEPGPAGLDIFQSVDVNPIDFFLYGNVLAIQIFVGLPAEYIYREPIVLQGTDCIKWQLG